MTKSIFDEPEISKVNDDILIEEVQHWFNELDVNVNNRFIWYDHDDYKSWNKFFKDRENGLIDPKNNYGKSITDEYRNKKTGEKRNLTRFWFNVKRFNKELKKGLITIGFVQMVVYHEALHAKYPNRTEKWIRNKSDKFFGVKKND